MMPYMRAIVRRRQRALADSDAAIAVSEYIAARAVRPIVGSERTRVIHNPIDAAEVERVAATAPDRQLPKRFVLFVGKLSRSKGAWLALEAFASLADPGAALVMVGDGPDRFALETASRERGLAVRFVPWVENREVWRIMRRAAAILVPSLWPESLSRTVTEAMTVGVPVIATDCGGIHDQIENRVSGAVLSPEPSAFAAELAHVLSDPGVGRAWTDAARRTIASRFDVGTVLPRIESLYAEVVEKRLELARG